MNSVITDLKPRLVAAGITAAVLTGRRHVDQKGNATPHTAADGGGRIVIIPNDDTFGAGSTQDFNARPRTLITRKCGAEVRFWAAADPAATDKDLDAMAKVRRLLHVFIRELRAIVRGQWQLGPGAWNYEQAETHLFGAEYVLTIVVDVPVSDKASTVTGPATPAINTDTSIPNEAP